MNARVLVAEHELLMAEMLVSEEGADLIVLDWMLPQVTGIERVAGCARSRTRELFLYLC